MPINSLVQYCDSLYHRPDRCETCGNECKGSCLECLAHIHKTTTNDRTYNCANIINCYTCKYIYKYSAETEHLLTPFKKWFEQIGNNPVTIGSIGCGPCSELFGLYQFREHNNLSFQIQYRGFELIEKWKHIHQKIESLNIADEIDFQYEDVFEYYNRNRNFPQILILNYVLSDIIRRCSSDDLTVFFENLYTLINRMCGKSFIVFNDINLGRDTAEARFYYNLIEQELQKRHIDVVTRKYHFPNSQRFYVQYGNELPNNITCNIPRNINQKYNPWAECRSAAIIIYKR